MSGGRTRRGGSAGRAAMLVLTALIVSAAGVVVAEADDSRAERASAARNPYARAEPATVQAARRLATDDLAGANDFSCRPIAGAPEPVVLLHDTFRDGTSFRAMAPHLQAAGICAFALDYGDAGTTGLAESSREIQAFVTGVLAATGASQVDIVGHGQGGLLPRQLVGPLGMADRVDDIVALAPANGGTDTPLVDPTGRDCPACRDLEPDSAFLTALNAGGDVVPGPDYTILWSVFDAVYTPSNTQTLQGPADQVNNERMEFACFGRFFDHDLDQDPAVAEITLNALQRDGTSDPDFTALTC